MGLDVSAYSKLTKIDAVFDANGYPIDPVTRAEIEGDYTQVYCNSDFPEQFDDLEDRAVYRYAEAVGVDCGGYGRYNRWRNELAKLAGYPLEQYEQYGSKWDSYCVACWNGATGPFSELINFSDCEGTIGPVTSAKLLADFDSFAERAAQHPDEEFRSQYRLWRQAFSLAADGGCVRFH